MKYFKPLLPIYIIMVCFILSLSGCSLTNSYEGKDIVDKAKRLHTELEAAHIRVSDISGGRETDELPVQEIWYRFQGDVMQYMYIGRDLETGEEYYEFNNGTELDTWHTGDRGWTGVAKGSEDFYSYSRAKRHYFADGNQLLDDHAAAVKSAKVQNEVSSVKRVSIEYDDEKIAQNEQMSETADYKQEYLTDIITDENGEITDTGFCRALFVSYSKDGADRSYYIYIEKRDPNEPIERVEPPALSESNDGGITEYTQ